MDVMCTKHPAARPLSAAIMETYPGSPPELLPVEITDNTVTEVSGGLFGGEGPGGAESVILQLWLLRFGAAIGELWLTVEDFAEW